MRTLQVQFTESDFRKYNLMDKQIIDFNLLKEKINLEQAKNALNECNSIAKIAGLSEMTLDEINAEIKDLRNAQNTP
jgi:geranylgeranyl pyrophosphate synthase